LLWDGGPTGGRGGTAETLLDAAARSKPCIWISTKGEPIVRDNLASGSSYAFAREVETRAAAPCEPDANPTIIPQAVLDGLLDTFWRLNRFNRESLRPTRRSIFSRSSVPR
jgi:hypothetical protein